MAVGVLAIAVAGGLAAAWASQGRSDEPSPTYLDDEFIENQIRGELAATMGRSVGVTCERPVVREAGGVFLCSVTDYPGAGIGSELRRSFRVRVRQVDNYGTIDWVIVQGSCEGEAC